MMALSTPRSTARAGGAGAAGETSPSALTLVSVTGTLNGQELELFRVGNYGAKGEYTAADMQGIVSRYAAAGETPIAIGHVTSDSEPAYGWIKNVRFADGVLFGTPGDVTPELDTLHQQKKYKNRSVAFARDPQGQLYVHHLAVLGAVPPHVQGLKEAKFSTGEYVEFSEGETMSEETKLQESIGAGIRTYFSEMFGGKKDTTGVDQAKLTADVTTAVEAKFSAALEAEKTERKRVETELATHKAQFSAGDQKLKVTAAIAGLKAAGAWVPAYEKMGVEQLFSSLAASPEVITFSDAKGVEQKPSVLDAAVAIFSAVGRIVPTGRKVDQTVSLEKQADVPVGVSPESAQFSAMVTEYASKHNIGWNTAYEKLSKEGKRPVAGSAGAGAV